MKKFKNMATYVELSRKFGNFNIILFIILSSLAILNYTTLTVMRYYNFSINKIGKPVLNFYYSPLLIFKKLDDPILLEIVKKKFSTVYVIVLFIFIFCLFLISNSKKGLLGTGRFATLQEVYEKGFISIGNDLKDGLILGRMPFQFTVKTGIFLVNFPLFIGNIVYIFTPNFKIILLYSIISIFGGLFFIIISEKKLTIIDSTNAHTALIAQTRSGKGAGVVIPTALNWIGSLFGFDPKKEIYDETHNYRKKVLNNKILLFDPYDEDYSNPDKIRYNPLAELNIGTKKEVDDITVVSEILTAPEKAGDKNHWTESAKNLVFGAILHLAYKNRHEGREVTLGEVYDFLTSSDVLMEIAKTIDCYHESPAFFRKIYDETQLNGVPEGVHPLVYRWANEMANKREEEFSDILSTTIACISLFKSPLIREATKKSDFKMNDLANGEQPYSLYLVIPESQIKTGGILIKLISTLFVSQLTPRDYINGNNKYKTIAILDEFPLFNYIPAIERAAGFIAGAKVKLLVIGQSLSQFWKIYGKENALLDNLANSVFYSSATTDYDTASKVSKILGNKTIEYSNSSSGSSVFSSKWSKTTAKRELMTPDEIINMDETRNLIMLRGDLRTIYGKKIMYYKEKFFVRKTKVV